MSSEVLICEILGAFASAKTPKQYRAAKRLCAKSFGPLEQLAFVDAARAARARIGGGP
jgi:hypothetical protein